MKMLLAAIAVLPVIPATPALAEGPPAGESYCYSIPPENCPYRYTYDQGRWWAYGIPLGKGPQEERREGREDGPRWQEDSGGLYTLPGPEEPGPSARHGQASQAKRGNQPSKAPVSASTSRGPA